MLNSQIFQYSTFGIVLLTSTIFLFKYDDGWIKNKLHKDPQIKDMVGAIPPLNARSKCKSETNPINLKLKTFPYELIDIKNPNETCVKIPKLEELKFNNIYWQVYKTFYLYSSYYDNRIIGNEKPVIRIIAILEGALPKEQINCQIWFNNGAKVVISANPSVVLINKGFAYAFMITCQIPDNVTNLIPNAVSLVEKPCDVATNLLKVVYNVPQGGKKDFAVCIKGLSYPNYDISTYIVEWMELLQIFGVDKVFFYEYDNHPNMSKVLQYYESQGLAQAMPITLPGEMPNLHGLIQKYINTALGKGGAFRSEMEQIINNDCFYMNVYSFNWIAIFDIDELVVPLIHNNWKDLINHVNLHFKVGKEVPTHYSIERRFSLQEMQHFEENDPTVPDYMFILKNVYRENKQDNIKSIYNTNINSNKLIMVSNHNPMQCYKRCPDKVIPHNTAITWHWRRGINPKKKDVVKDTGIYRFKNELIARTSKTLRFLDLI